MPRRWRRPLERVDVDRESSADDGADAVDHLLDRLRQAQPIEMIRPEVVGDLRTSLIDCAAVAAISSRCSRALRGVPARHRAEKCAVLDDQQVLSEAVVQLGGDALPLRLLRGDQLLCEALVRGLAAPRVTRRR